MSAKQCDSTRQHYNHTLQSKRRKNYEIRFRDHMIRARRYHGRFINSCHARLRP